MKKLIALAGILISCSALASQNYLDCYVGLKESPTDEGIEINPVYKDGKLDHTGAGGEQPISVMGPFGSAQMEEPSNPFIPGLSAKASMSYGTLSMTLSDSIRGKSVTQLFSGLELWEKPVTTKIEYASGELFLEPSLSGWPGLPGEPVSEVDFTCSKITY